MGGSGVCAERRGGWACVIGGGDLCDGGCGVYDGELLGVVCVMEDWGGVACVMEDWGGVACVMEDSGEVWRV